MIFLYCSPYILLIATFEGKPQIVKILLENRLWTGLDLSNVDSVGNKVFLAACHYGRSDSAKVFLSLLDQKELEALKSPSSGLSALQLALNCVRNTRNTSSNASDCHAIKKPNNYEEMLKLFDEDYDNIGFYDGIVFRRFGGLCLGSTGKEECASTINEWRRLRRFRKIYLFNIESTVSRIRS